MEEKIIYEEGAIEYIAKMAEGGMRDAITMLDKCLSFSNNLTIENVVKALGAVDYDIMVELTNAILSHDNEKMITIITDINNSGADLKQFIKLYSEFVLDISIWLMTKSEKLIKVPKMWAEKFKSDIKMKGLLECVVKLRNDIKYEHNPKPVIISTFLLFEE